MKTSAVLSKFSRNANVLVVTMVTAGVISAILVSYLTLLQSRTTIRARSQAWNTAIPVLESGVEEAFAHLRTDFPSMTANGWTNATIGGVAVISKSRTLPDGSYFSVNLYNATSNNPMIYSSGFVPVPLGRGFITRTVQVCTTNPSTFTKAIAAKSTISLGSSVIVDSYDSTSTNYSSNGQYDPAKRKSNGGVVTDSSAHPAITLGSGAHIYGMAETGPAGTYNLNSSASIGDAAWSSTHTGIENGFTNNDMNVTYSDNSLPAGAALWSPLVLPGIYPYQGTNYTYLLGTGSNTVATLALASQDVMAVSGNATLYVVGNVSIAGNAKIYIAPGGSLKLIVGGATATLAGGGIVNGTGVAANFSYIGLPTNLSLSYSGGAAFQGTVNAPEASFDFTGGADIYGSIIVNSFTSAGHANFHYDEGLGDLSHLVLVSYREL